MWSGPLRRSFLIAAVYGVAQLVYYVASIDYLHRNF